MGHVQGKAHRAGDVDKCEEQESDVYGPYYSLPETFIPSESPDAISVELQNSNFGTSVEGLVSRILKLLSKTLIFPAKIKQERSSNKSTQGSRAKVGVEAAEALVKLHRSGFVRRYRRP